MIALRDFRYREDATGKVIEVTQGQQVDPEHLAKNRCDIEKFVRTKFVGQEDLGTVPVPRKRGRPRKTA